MKTVLIFLAAVLIAFTATAQQGINYKALIKDNLGNVVANQTIDVRFTIIADTGPTNVYVETHTGVATDANGIVILNIGEGTTSDVFTDIAWGSDTHALKVEIDIEQDASFVDMGTTQFMAVPYALQAETATTASNVTGLEALDEGNGIGRRLVGKNPANYGDIGLNAVDLSFSGVFSLTFGASGTRSTAIGSNTRASNFASTAMGNATAASGNSSTAMGFGTTALGDYATAMGRGTTASGNWSTTMGFDTTALGNISTAMGWGTNASSLGSTAIGRYNIGGGNATAWVETDKLFEIGNGASYLAIKNAFTVLKNGKVGISTATPTVQLQITGGGDAKLTGESGYLVIGEENGVNIVMDNNEIMARNNGSPSNLHLQTNGGAVWVNSEVVYSSDRRLKKDIVNLPYGLNEILQLQPKAYNWKNREQKHKSLGLIAQDVQSIIKEIVLVDEDENKTLSINYTELIPVLIKAIQEQQEIINSLQSTVGSQQSEMQSLRSTVFSQQSEFNKRLKQLEDAFNTIEQ